MMTSTLQPTARQTQPLAIEARGLDMSFQSGSLSIQVLHNINLSVNCGEIKFLMGPSGSGKTTLLSILAGILTPTAGEVRLLGTEITQLSRKQLARFRRLHIGFIYQSINLFSTLSVLENVEVALNLHDIKGAQAQTRALQYLDLVGLADKADCKPSDLSGGEKQRVAIARALVGHPQLIVADEPTASLDSENGKIVMEILYRLTKESGCTALVVTHDPRIQSFADGIIHLEDGRIVAESSPTDANRSNNYLELQRV